MTVHEISDYFNQTPNVEKAYKEHKPIGRLIRSNVFKYSSRRYYDKMDISYKITYIKSNRNNELVVNLKVSGTMGRVWNSDKNPCITEYSKVHRSSNRTRNQDIRRAVRDDVQKFFRLFGVDSYKIEIGKIKACKEL